MLDSAILKQVHVLDHPLVAHKLTLLREKGLSTSSFREIVSELGLILAYEMTRSLRTTEVEIETPVATTRGRVIDGKKLVLVPVLRAGLRLVDGMLRLLPSARIGHVGLYRDPTTLGAVEYYNKLPADMQERDVIVADPMLATGNSAIAAIELVKRRTPRSIALACLVAAPEGLQKFVAAHPDVPVYTTAVDRGLNDHGYIVPGLGDAGDRLFGTK
jgi:uracil phosphoribosyltransferase